MKSFTKQAHRSSADQEMGENKRLRSNSYYIGRVIPCMLNSTIILGELFTKLNPQTLALFRQKTESMSPANLVNKI